MSEKQQDISVKQAEIDWKSKRLDELNAEVTQLKQELVRNQLCIERLEQDNQNKETQYAQQVEDMRSQLSAKSDQLLSNSQSNRRLTQQCTDLQMQQTQSEALIRRQTQECNKMKDSLASYELNNKSLKY